MADSQTAARASLEMQGTLAGGSLKGTFHSWGSPERERDDARLGPGLEQQFRLGERYYAVDANGIVREWHGSLLRRARTQRAIDQAELTADAGCCTYKGIATVGSLRAYEISVAAKQGETESLFLDTQTYLPRRISYVDGDGLTTIDFSDWRNIGGRRVPFRQVESTGNRRFDVTQLTTGVKAGGTFDDSVFALPRSRTIESNAVEEVAIESARGHIYVPVQIAGRSLRFLLDSGSQDVVLDRSVAKSLGLAQSGDLEAVGTGRTPGVRVATLAELRVGSARMRNLIVDTLDLRRSTGGAFDADGILGYPFFAEAAVQVDPGAGRLRFGKPGTIALRGERLTLDLDRQLPLTSLKLNDVNGDFLIDTGNSGDLVLFGPFVERNPGLIATTMANRSNAGVGGLASSYRSAVSELDLGSIVLRNLPADVMESRTGAFADQLIAGDVGLAILHNYVLTFDYAGDALTLSG